MTKIKTSNPLSSSAFSFFDLKLLAVLDENQEQVYQSSLDGKIVLIEAINNVSIAKYLNYPTIIDPIIIHGFAEWTDNSLRRKLQITNAGRSFLIASQTKLKRSAPMAENAVLMGGSRRKISLRSTQFSANSWLIKPENQISRRGFPCLTQDEINAGQRLKMDFIMSDNAPRLRSNWDRVSTVRTPFNSDAIEVNQKVRKARERVMAALLAVGADLSRLLVDLCYHLKPLEVIKIERNWSNRAAESVLRNALRALAAHYLNAMNVNAKVPRKATDVK